MARETTLWYWSMRGVPSSVKAQMKTMVEPAKTPGMARGRVMRRKLRERRPPRFCGGFEHGGVDVGQGGLEVEVGDGVEAQGDECGEGPEAAGGEPVDALVVGEDVEVLEEDGERAEGCRGGCFMPMAPTKGGRIMGARTRADQKGFAAEVEVLADEGQGEGDEVGRGA